MYKRLAAAFLFLAVMCGTSWGAVDPFRLSTGYISPDYEGQVYDRYGNTDYNFFYQLRDVTGSARREEVGGPQWFATVYENYYTHLHYNDDDIAIYRRTMGGEIPDITFTTAGDLIDGFNFVLAEEPQPYESSWRRYLNENTTLYDKYPDPVESLCLVISNGQGEFNVTFGNPYARHFPFWWNSINDSAAGAKWWQGTYDWRNDIYMSAEPIEFICSSPDIYARNSSGNYEKVYTISGDSVSSDLVVLDTAGNVVYKISGDISVRHDITSNDAVVYTVSDDKVYDANNNLVYSIESYDGDRYICAVRSVNESISVSDFDDYYTINVNPSGESPISSGNSLAANVKIHGFNSAYYGSRLGYITFRQRASFAPGYTNYREFTSLPMVIANVSQGNASDNPLIFDMTVFDGSEVVNRLKFTWDVQRDNTGQDLGTFFMIGSADKKYSLETRITNRTGTRYELYRYDMIDAIENNSANREGYVSIMPDYWRYDLTPDLYGTLPDYFLLDAHSQIAPGLVTVYKNNIGEGYSTIDTQYDTSESFRLYEYSASTPRNLRLNYKRIRGIHLLKNYNLSGVNVKEISMDFADVVQDEDETAYELEQIMGKPYVMVKASVPSGAFRAAASDSGPDGLVESVDINSSAIGAFHYSKSVDPNLVSDTISDSTPSEDVTPPAPDNTISQDINNQQEQGDNNGDRMLAMMFRVSDTVVSKEIPLQPLSIRMRVPRQNQLVVDHWEEFDNAANSQELFNAFARYGTVWVRAKTTVEMDTNLFTAINNKGADKGISAADCVRAFLYNDELYLDFIVFIADAASTRSGTSAYVNVFKDDDVPYILIGDGSENGKWDITFYVSAAGENPEPRGDNSTPTNTNTEQQPSSSSGGGGGGGCNLGLVGMMGAVLLVGMIKRYR